MIKAISKIPWVSFITKKVTQAGDKAFSLFKRYIVPPAEKYIIGDLKNFSVRQLDPKGELVLSQFGFLGNIAQWRPRSKEELAEVLYELDQQPQGRYPYRSACALTGSSYFLLADTSPLAQIH